MSCLHLVLATLHMRFRRENRLELVTLNTILSVLINKQQRETMGRLPPVSAADADGDARQTLGPMGWLPALPFCDGPYSLCPDAFGSFMTHSIARDSRMGSIDRSMNSEGTEVGSIEMRTREGMR